MPNIDRRELVASLYEYGRRRFSGYLLGKLLGEIGKYLSFAINTTIGLSEGIPGVGIAKRLAGYMMVLYGQYLLTEAEFYSPGSGDWWGYDERLKWPL